MNELVYEIRYDEGGNKKKQIKGRRNIYFIKNRTRQRKP